MEEKESVLKRAMAELEAKRDNPDGITGIPSGLSDLDRRTGGFQNGNLIILGGRPAMGKSALAISMMRNASVDFRIPIAYFTLQLTYVEVVNRLIAAEAELDSVKLLKGNLADYEWEQLVHKTGRLEKAPIKISDRYHLTTTELAEECRQLKSRHDIQMVFIDDIHSMTLTYEQRKIASSKEQEISIIVRELKALAKELDIPVLAISRLSRSVEIRGGAKRPILQDLRDSGALEDEADMVMFLYRHEYYGIMEDEEGMPQQGVAEVIIAKHRNGSLDTVELKFIGKYTRFTDRSPQGPDFNNFTRSNGGMQTFGSKKEEMARKKIKRDKGFGYKIFPEDDAPF